MDFMRSVLAGHPEEIYSLLKFKLGGCETVRSKCDYDQMSSSMRTCYQYLNQTSRSFAAVIQALDDDLSPLLCILYLVLRALDTVEDDMTIPLDTKLDMLHNFHTYLHDPEWRYMESRDKDRKVLEDFPTISREYRKLKPLYQEVISDTCKKMGAGMAEFLQKEVDTLEDWDKYCSYSAGLVGIGLSRLFCASGYEDKLVEEDQGLANSVGLLMQKTNTIMDYLEDQMGNREFWPRQLATGKVMEQGPVLVISFTAQQIMVVRNAKGEVTEGDPNKVLKVIYVWALCRDQEEFDPRASWKLMDLSASHSTQLL